MVLIWVFWGFFGCLFGWLVGFNPDFFFNTESKFNDFY